MQDPEFYDQYVVIPEQYKGWYRLDYLDASFTQADRDAVTAWLAELGPDTWFLQMFMRYLKQGRVDYFRYYFRDQADAALFKLTFAHLRLALK